MDIQLTLTDRHIAAFLEQYEFVDDGSQKPEDFITTNLASMIEGIAYSKDIRDAINAARDAKIQELSNNAPVKASAVVI